MATQPVQIRPFRESDAGAVIALWKSVFGYTTAHNDPERALRAKLALDPELLLVAADEGRVVGTIMGGYDGHRGWIYSLAVDPDRRRQGIGTALVRAVEQALTARGCMKINLQVLPTNAQTVAFYEFVGYRVEERISMGKVL
jgi:ribosomal protein S18 acetylase RimI-like enzyme